MVLDNQRGDLGTWQLVFAVVLMLSTLWFVSHAVRKRVKGVPEFFREWAGWRRLARVVSVVVPVLGTLTLVFG